MGVQEQQATESTLLVEARSTGAVDYPCGHQEGGHAHCPWLRTMLECLVTVAISLVVAMDQVNGDKFRLH